MESQATPFWRVRGIKSKTSRACKALFQSIFRVCSSRRRFRCFFTWLRTLVELTFWRSCRNCCSKYLMEMLNYHTKEHQWKEWLEYRRRLVCWTRQLKKDWPFGSERISLGSGWSETDFYGCASGIERHCLWQKICTRCKNVEILRKF